MTNLYRKPWKWKHCLFFLRVYVNHFFWMSCKFQSLLRLALDQLKHFWINNPSTVYCSCYTYYTLIDYTIVTGQFIIKILRGYLLILYSNFTHLWLGKTCSNTCNLSKPIRCYKLALSLRPGMLTEQRWVHISAASIHELVAFCVVLSPTITLIYGDSAMGSNLEGCSSNHQCAARILLMLNQADRRGQQPNNKILKLSGWCLKKVNKCGARDTSPSQPTLPHTLIYLNHKPAVGDHHWFSSISAPEDRSKQTIMSSLSQIYALSWEDIGSNMKRNEKNVSPISDCDKLNHSSDGPASCQDVTSCMRFCNVTQENKRHSTSIHASVE